MTPPLSKGSKGCGAWKLTMACTARHRGRLTGDLSSFLGTDEGEMLRQCLCQGQRKGAFEGRGQASKDLEAGTKGDPGVTEGGGQREERAGVHPSQHPCSRRVESREARAEPGPIAQPWMREEGTQGG